ncbi:MAG: tetratricopeptide repeat protein [Bryobacteraceae bacterium]|jgi:tetratricopeptide (TPR) repeat protein
MSFWRQEVVEAALGAETRRQMAEQRAWIEREPANPRPYFHLAQFYRMEGRQDDGLGLLLEAVRLDPQFASAHAALAEIYTVRGDYNEAWRHARAAESYGDPHAADMLRRHGIAE